MTKRNASLIGLGALMIGGGMWFDAAFDAPIELIGDVVAALGGVVIALGFVAQRRR